MRAPQLNRALVLEAVERLPDGAGGFVEAWTALGVLWAAVLPGSGGDSLGEERMLSSVPYRVIVRGAPVGSALRPLAGLRVREGARLFWVQAVTERDPEGRHLTCFVREEVPK